MNSGRRSLKVEVREGCPKTAVVSENIDAVRGLIMQDLHVTYREIEASLGISSTSMHSILHEREIGSQNRSKKARVNLCKEIMKKYYRGA